MVAIAPPAKQTSSFTQVVIAAVIFFGLAIVFALVRVATRSSPYMGWATWVAIILAATNSRVIR